MNTKSTFLRRVSAMTLLSVLSIGAQAGVTTRVSVDSSGREAFNHHPGFTFAQHILSGNGRYVAFSSEASVLVPGDTNDSEDVFVHDRETGATRRVSVNNVGQQGNDGSSAPSVNANGRYVAFGSDAKNLVPGDTNGEGDVFVHDRRLGTTTRISVTAAGGQGNAWSNLPSISADGRYVAFLSIASNLVPGDTNNVADIFVNDRQTGTTSRVSVDNTGGQGNGQSYNLFMSADGRYVAFDSDSTNLVPGDTNNVGDVFIHDLQTGITTRASVNSGGEEGNEVAVSPSLSADGRYVSFASFASNMVPNDTNNELDIFVRDRTQDITSRVSVNNAGVQSDGRSYFSAISANGRYVAFDSLASNFAPGDTDEGWGVYVRDRWLNTISRVSVDSIGRQGNEFSVGPSISADGRSVAFESYASNLVPGDTNFTLDVFVHDRFATLLEGPHGTATCSDGLDNDSDGDVDAADSHCALPPPQRMCNGQYVTIFGTAGDDHYTGTRYDDVIAGLGGNDVLDGAGGNDVICGGSGDDTLSGGKGDDHLLGGAGDDKFNADIGTDRCNGQAGVDTHLGGCEMLTNIP